MPKKNFYAVKSGRKTGIFESWEACKEQVSGYPKAEYKGFSTRREAKDYLNGEVSVQSAQVKTKPQADVVVYVDGSYDAERQVYGYGCVILLESGEVQTFNGAGNNPESVELRNVTGEMLGAMRAVQYAIKNKFRSIQICYDYYGIECWVTEKWKAKTDLTKKYADAMKSWGRIIDISFQKVAAHTNVKYNEMADQLAKDAVKNF
jgi:ribonuclease HI